MGVRAEAAKFVGICYAAENIYTCILNVRWGYNLTNQFVNWKYHNSKIHLIQLAHWTA